MLRGHCGRSVVGVGAPRFVVDVGGLWSGVGVPWSCGHALVRGWCGWSVVGVGGPWSMVGVGGPWSLWVLCGQCGHAPVCGWCGWSVVGVGGPWLVWVHCFPAEGHLVAARILVL